MRVLPAAKSMFLTLDVEREADGRCIADVLDLPGVLVYGATAVKEVARVQALARRIRARSVDAAAIAQLTPLPRAG